MKPEAFHNMCVRKRQWVTWYRAEKAKARNVKRFGIPLKVYPCPVCLGFHLTKDNGAIAAKRAKEIVPIVVEAAPISEPIRRKSKSRLRHDELTEQFRIAHPDWSGVQIKKAVGKIVHREMLKGTMCQQRKLESTANIADVPRPQSEIAMPSGVTIDLGQTEERFA